MKKVLITVVSVVIVVACLFSLAACGSKVTYTFGKEVVSVNAQIDILTNMSKGSADVGVMDSIMAGYYMSKNYKDTMEVLPFYLSEEEYGIGAKKGNDALMGKINEALIALKATLVMDGIGEQFGVKDEIIVKTSMTNPKANATDDSWNNLIGKTQPKLIVGYTVFAPIAYTEDGKFTGFDIELAKAVVNYLNIRYNVNIALEFLEIDWDQKEALLENGSIDLVWNGMTINEERQKNMSLSIPYLANKQAIIILKADKEKYDVTSLEKFKDSAKNAIVNVEAGSAAEELMVIKK